MVVMKKILQIHVPYEKFKMIAAYCVDNGITWTRFINQLIDSFFEDLNKPVSF